MTSKRLGFWAVVALLATGTLLADTVHLATGGVAKGKILEETAAGVKIRTVGVVLFIAREKIKNVTYEKTQQEIYEKVKPLYRDTASDQFKLAQWCARHRLRKQMRHHLQRVIKWDPDHAHARRMLGYVEHDGKWVTRDEKMRLSGYVRYKGRWMLPLEREILEREDNARKEAREWYQKCRTIAALLKHKDARRRDQGYQQLAAISDPMAIKPMFDMLTREDVSIRVLLVEALGRFIDKEAKLALVRLALADRADRVRNAAVDALGKHKDPMALTWLKRALKPKNRTAMLRAAEALGKIGDMSVVVPLIEVLITRHAKQVRERQPGIGLGNVTPIVLGYDAEVERGAAAVTPRIGYLSSGVLGATDETRVVWVKRENREVLDALRALTGVNYAYNKKAWRRWYKEFEARHKGEREAAGLPALAPTTAPTTSPSKP